MRLIRFIFPSEAASANRGGKCPCLLFFRRQTRQRQAGTPAATHAFVALCLFLFTLATAAHAQSVRWEPAGGSLAVGQTSELSLIFENCEPEGDVALPTVDGLLFGRPNRGEQSSFNIVNGRANSQRTIYLTYPVRPSRKTPVAIPGFEVKTDKGVQRVAPVNFDVGEATVGGTSIPLESAANSRLTAGSGPVWAGEIIPINYTLSVSTRFPFNIASNPEWTPAPLVVEEWAKPEPFSNVVNGESRNNALYRSRGYIKEPGSYTLNAVQQLVNLRVPSSGFTIFQAFQAEQFTITSNKPALVVRPLPQPAPAAFSGAVGDFTLTSKIVPATATVSEPITWTLELAGTGNWPDVAGLPGREVSKDFRIVQPQAKRTPKENTIFDATLSEDVVLIPTKPGTYTLGPVAWSYFDPKTGQYKTITTEKVTVTVTPSAPAPTSSFTPPQVTTEPGADATLEAPRAK
ncbi:MAG TPA: BatD family protein, partial [Opitutaceae bacterium]